MNRSLPILCSCFAGALAAAVSAGVAGEPGSEAWNAKRAELFSDVCMAAAPDYAALDALAEKAGMQKQDGVWVSEPDIVVNLMAHDGFCDCFMSVRAPDPGAMDDKIFDQLMVDYGDAFTGKPDGLANVAPFQRDGVEVVSILEPEDHDDGKWILARAAVYGACPEAEVRE